MARELIGLALVAALAIGLGCGGKRGVGGAGGGRTAPSLPAANPEALRHFEAGLRALKLGGPEAHEKARPRLERAVAIDANLWEAHHNLGVIAFAGGDDAAAVSAFSSALEINPAHRPSRLARAEAHRRLGARGKARADYRSAIEDDKSDALAYARLASLHREAGEHDKGLAVIRQALVEIGAAPAIYVEQGLLYLAQGKEGLAELVLLKAAELNKKEPSIHNALALVSLARGNAQEAFNRFDVASSLDPDYLDARFNRAAVLMDAGDHEGARKELSVIVGKRPDDLEARVALGVAHRGLGEYDRARDLWERVVDGAPRGSPIAGDALWNLAVLEMDFVKDVKKAARALERYQRGAGRNHPRRAKARERLKELES
jgi:tetratricopeptide (TPR) repeat protein